MASSSEFHIFRDSRRRTSAAELVSEIRFELSHLPKRPGPQRLNTLLLRAGELECALSDAEAPSAICEHAVRLTDLFANVVQLSASELCDGQQLSSIALSILDQIRYSGTLTVSTPEGFAYYALHPLDYADLIARLPINRRSAHVIGVRSIGTTLSAVVSEKLREQGVAAERFTVRPAGHPYDRRCDLDSTQRQKLASALAADATFVICDEGPGRSGSSLLSVAEALEREGVPCSHILILCAYEPDLAALCAPDAARRWSRYRFAAAEMTGRLPNDATEYLGSGGWRRRLIPASQPWPAVWPQMERLRYGSSDGQTIFTFEGHGAYGAAVRARNEAAAKQGFGLPYFGQEEGFGQHRFATGRMGWPEQISPQLLTHIARYCAWRALEFAVPNVDLAQLETMVRVNFEREFGMPMNEMSLEVALPTVCDARMMPHEWLHTSSGSWLKLNSEIHGDDHFFPGPCDIAWDLAGVIVEWELTGSAREFFLEAYRNASGDDAAARIACYEVAYSTFRMAWSKMAAASVTGSDEEHRLLSDHRRHKDFLERAQRRDPSAADHRVIVCENSPVVGHSL